jgi:UDP-glucose 4-epimerase
LDKDGVRQRESDEKDLPDHANAGQASDNINASGKGSTIGQGSGFSVKKVVNKKEKIVEKHVKTGDME